MTIDQSKIDATLASMSAWSEPSEGVWQSALTRTSPVRRRGLARVLKPSNILAALLVIVISGLLVGTLVPSLARSRHAERGLVESAPKTSVAASAPPMFENPGRSGGLARNDSTLMAYAGGERKVASAAPASPPVPSQPGAAPAAEGPVDRMVIRKATVELKTRDVRAAFAKAAQVCSEAQGEYMESSSLTGERETMQGTLTLRVATNRLSTVLNQLRGLAEVTGEDSSGEDITDQFVDLEARLRNEQRVETELLELLTSRKDAPLRDVLELRDSIARVRESIERMTAQRERLSRLVSLATVLVIIRPDSIKPPPIPDGLGRYFLRQLQGAWQGALTFLADTVALLVQVIVGGAVFWVVGALFLGAAAAARRRAKRNLGREPAPSVEV